MSWFPVAAVAALAETLLTPLLILFPLHSPLLTTSLVAAAEASSGVLLAHLHLSTHHDPMALR